MCASDSPCCPPDSKSQVPLLNHPVTLYCGHSVSSSHVRLPHIPLPDLTGYPPADAHGIMEAYHARRLALWAKVPCPLPNCRHHDALAYAQAMTDHGGVPYYPPEGELGNASSIAQVVRCPPPSELSGRSTDKTLMDVTVAKILALVWKQMNLEALEERRAEMIRPSLIRSNTEDTVVSETDGEEADAEDEDDEEQSPLKRKSGNQSSSLLHVPVEGGSSRPVAPGLVRTSSKRRRQVIGSEQYSSPPHKRSSHLPTDVASGSTSGRPTIGRRKASLSFEKELCAVLECDVCAQILHLPVTTACQHVSRELSYRPGKRSELIPFTVCP
jgi:hypothetical protein